MTPRCISLRDDTRCPRKAAKRNGDRYLCRKCGTPWAMVMVADQYGIQTRQVLATSDWETRDEGQRIVNRLNRRTA